MVGHPPAHHARNPCSTAAWAPWELGRGPGAGDVLAPADAHPELQAVEPIESAHTLAIHAPTFATQQHPDAQAPEPGSRVRDLANP